MINICAVARVLDCCSMSFSPRALSAAQRVQSAPNGGLSGAPWETSFMIIVSDGRLQHFFIRLEGAIEKKKAVIHVLKFSFEENKASTLKICKSHAMVDEIMSLTVSRVCFYLILFFYIHLV